MAGEVNVSLMVLTVSTEGEGDRLLALLIRRSPWTDWSRPTHDAATAG